jgi:glycosyltransferase involved in cell wall biosynthesis
MPTEICASEHRGDAAMSAIVMVGAFPPPVHGMASVNKAIRDRLIAAGCRPAIFDLAGIGMRRSIAARLLRLPRVLWGLVRFGLLPKAPGRTLYMSVSGGFGKFYEVFFVCIARLRGDAIILHHHTFAYLDRYSVLAKVVVWFAGKRAIHVVLSSGMAMRLVSTYSVAHPLVVSNAVFFSHLLSSELVRMRNSLRTLGFLSNISTEKGIFLFIGLIEECHRRGVPVNAMVAGPFQDPATERRVRRRLEALPFVKYFGAVYGDDKELFFSQIDAFVFPTLYVNEAEPLTVYEALSRGVPVIAYGRGSIPEVVTKDCGYVVDPDDEFISTAIPRIEQWLAHSESFAAASVAARLRVSHILEDNLPHLNVLMETLRGDGCK